MKYARQVLLAVAVGILADAAVRAGQLPALADPRTTPLRDLPKECPWYKDSMPTEEQTFAPIWIQFARDSLSGRYAERGVRDPAWDDDVKALLEFVECDGGAGERPELRGALRSPPYRAVLDKGCRDPMARMIALGVGLEEMPAEEREAAWPQLLELAESVAGDGEQSRYARLIAARFCAVGARGTRADPQKYGRCSRVFYDMLIRMRVEDLFPEPYGDEMFYRLWSRFAMPADLPEKDAYGVDYLAEAVEKLPEQEREKMTGALALVKGAAYRKLAWEARGAAAAVNVSEEGWNGFRHYIPLATEQLSAAYGVDPRNPFVCAMMISQARDDRNIAENTEAWFTRGLWARFDNQDLYTNMLWGMQPHMGGSHARMASFAWECLYTNRFSTWIPAFFPKTIYAIASETGPQWRSLYRERRIQEALEECYKGYLETVEDPELKRDIRANYAVVLYLCGDYEGALREFGSLSAVPGQAWKYSPKFVGTNFSARLSTLQAAAELFRGQHAERMREADAAQIEGEPLRAVRLFRDICGNFPADSPEAGYLRRRVAECMLLSGLDDSIETRKAFQSLDYPANRERAAERAAFAQRTDALEILLAMGAPKTQELLTYPIGRNAIGTVQFLIESGVDPTVKFPEENYSVTHYAARHGSVDLLKMLYEYDSDIERVFGDGPTPLQSAVYGHKFANVRFLLDKGASPNTATGDSSPLLIASRLGFPEIAEMLLGAGADPNAVEDGEGMAALHTVVVHDRDAAITRLLLKNGAEVDKTDASGRTPLLIAAEFGRVEHAKALLEAGANPNGIAPGRQSPLMLAALGGFVPIIEELAKAGTDLDATDSNGVTALEAASAAGKSESVTALVRLGADLNKAGKPQGMPPVHAAIINQHDEALMILLRARASPNILSRQGRTPFDEAMLRGTREAAELVIDYQANVDMPGPGKGGFLHHAIRAGDQKLFDKIMDLGPDIDMPGAGSATPLHTAAQFGRSAMAEALLARRANVLVHDASGNRPSAVATAGGHAALASRLWLLEMKAYVFRYGPIIALAVAAVFIALYLRRERLDYQARRETRTRIVRRETRIVRRETQTKPRKKK